MATQAEKLELAAVSGLLSGSSTVLRRQIPAVRDSLVRARLEHVLTVLAQAQARVDGVLGE